jgi:hypothetical protein
LEAAGFTFSARSQFDAAQKPDETSTVFLIDTTGELCDWTAHADAVIIGKSFLSVGGQNPAEAILAKRTADLESKTRDAERAALKVKTERIYLANEGRSEASSIDGSTPFDYLWQVFGGQFAEDERGIHLIDATGNPQIDTETGKRITPADLFQKLRDDPVHGVSFKPRFGSGSGVRAGRDGRVTTAEQLDGLKTSQLLQIGLRNARKTA